MIASRLIAAITIVAVGTFSSFACMAEEAELALEPQVAIRLSNKEMPSLKLYGVAAESFLMVGKRSQLKKWISNPRNVSFAHHRCECYLVKDISQCLVTTGVSIPVPSRFRNIDGIFIVVEGNVLSQVVRKKTFQQSPPSPHAQPTPVEASPPPLPPTSGNQLEQPPAIPTATCSEEHCSPIGSVTINTDGEIGVSVGCEDGIDVEITTDGEVSFSLTVGGVQIEHAAARGQSAP